MAKRILQHTGKKALDLHSSIKLFFLYVGHLFSSLLFRNYLVSWRPTLPAVISAGAFLLIPLLVVSMLIGVSLTLTINYILAPFNLQNQGLFIAQNMIIRDIAPLPIGFIFCVQCGLNLINANHPSLHHAPDKVMLETIIPLVIGVNLTSILLYTYVTAAFFVSVFFTFTTILHMNIDEYILRLSELVAPLDIISSLIKTIIYATIASLIAGYYYYDVAKRILPVRQAVSRIITRGLFWLVVGSVFIKVYFPII